MAELSALAKLRIAGESFLLRAGISRFRSYDHEGRGDPRNRFGYHAGVSAFTGKRGDRVRVRLDYTYRWFDTSAGGFSTVGLGLVFPFR